MNTMKKVMDYDTAEHFYKWLEVAVFVEDQSEVEDQIHALLRSDPELINDHSWPEIRTMAYKFDAEVKS